ncbi:MAG: nucleotidyltransferase domain-containing protein [Bacteroidales bacterium]|jgi:predicted nucleotidyltransferase|nr:MAG: Nucleotidyltransferase domain protein [Bacteroidetes bacterium ADurb.Bin012]HNV63344.1 nucleotidyltransferase domain-containing protein [Candidatus Cloacimonas acidaminovorans]HPM22126.1 nucleotidyltransferase domain-containing protein [Thermotogota bacterium]
MRLNEFQIETINTLAKKHFGEGTTVYLFGSRTDENKKGGDIDLFITNKDEKKLNIEAKVRFLAELKAKIGDRKIDVVFDNAFTRQKENFYRTIIRERVKL